MKIENVIIERALFEDLQEIFLLQKSAFITEAEAHGNYDIEPLKQTYESVCADFDQYLFLKAVYRQIIIGSVKSRSKGDVVWIGKLMVSQRFRNNGIAKRFLSEVETYYPLAVNFQLFTAAASGHNIRFYQSLGYEVKREYRDDKQNGFMMVEMIKQVK